MLSAFDPEAGPPVPFATSYQPTPSLAQALGANSATVLSDRPTPARDDTADALQSSVAREHLENEERFRQIVEGLQQVVSLSDESGKQLFFVNAAYERIWGQPRERMYEDPMAFLDSVDPQDRERVRGAIFGVPGKEFDVAFRIVRPDGEQRWVRSRGFPVRNDDGDIYRIASITEDVTEHKAITDSHDRLLRGFTHDMKNPLGAADGYLSLLEIGVFGELPEAQLETVVRARRSIGAALNLVSQLLDIERAKAGELIIKRERFDLGALTRDCVEDFRSAANAKRQSLTFQISPADDALVVESDRARVRQILANLLSNAVKYTQPGGNITASARSADDEAAPWRGRCVAVAVADNGPGIPAEKHKLLFREFTRFDPDAAEGSGIGLAISQHIAHALGAALTFKSTPGIGSTFTLWLPRDREPPLTR